jgi:hypothetical protein
VSSAEQGPRGPHSANDERSLAIRSQPLALSGTDGPDSCTAGSAIGVQHRGRSRHSQARFGKRTASTGVHDGHAHAGDWRPRPVTVRLATFIVHVFAYRCRYFAANDHFCTSVRRSSRRGDRGARRHPHPHPHP